MRGHGVGRIIRNGLEINWNKALCEQCVLSADADQLEFTRSSLLTTHQIHIETSRRCNLHCRHCCVQSDDGAPLLSVSAVSALARILGRRSSPPRVIISGGEPTVHPDLLTLLDSLGPLADLMLLTNGTQITEQLASELSARAARVQITLTGHNPKQDAILRGGCAFSEAITGIRALLTAGVAVSVSVPLHKSNFLSIEDMVELLVRLGVVRVGFTTMVPVGRGHDLAELCLELVDLFQSLELIAGARRRWARQIEVYTSGAAFAAMPRLLRNLQLVLGCTRAHEVSVDCRGTLIPCEMWQSVNGPTMHIERAVEGEGYQ